MSMATVEAAAKHSMQLVAAAAIGVVVGSIVMSAVEKVAGGRLAEEAQGGRLNLPAAVLASVLHPAQVRKERNKEHALRVDWGGPAGYKAEGAPASHPA